MIEIRIPYGKRDLKFSLPSERLLGILENKKFRSSKNLKTLISESLSSASSKKILDGLSFSVNNILVVVPDATRSSHLKIILPALLKKIKKEPSRIGIIIATGMHKKHSADQLKNLLGKGIVGKYKVIQHEQNSLSLVNFGRTSDGIPITLNKNLAKYDAIISIGVIEPHLYAGYSGGAKTIAIGLAGEDTINATHNVSFIDNDLTRIGTIKNNPFQKSLWDIIANVKVAFSVNIVNDSSSRAIKVFSGDIRKVFESGVAFAKDVFEVEARRQADIVICGVGYPKDVNLYQASRAINYIANVDRPILKRGGILIVAAELCDGAGQGLGEKRFLNELKKMNSPKEFVRKLKQSKSCIAGVHRAYMVAKVLSDYKVIFVSKNGSKVMKDTPFLCFENIHNALTYADKTTGEDAKIYIVSHALSTITKTKKLP